MKDLCIRESYTDKEGNEKTSWSKVGILIETNGKVYVKLFHIPGTLISVFEQKKREEKPAATSQSAEEQVAWDE